MSSKLSINEIASDGRIVSNFVADADFEIGREPAVTGLTLDYNGVSRVHALVIQRVLHWFYCDCASTNGSWINGKQAQANKFYLIRAGDKIQLADAALEISNVSIPGRVLGAEIARAEAEGALSAYEQTAPSEVLLFVFKNNEFQASYPMQSVGKLLVVGGDLGDLKIVGDSSRESLLAFERKADQLHLQINVGKDRAVFLNEAEVFTDQVLQDRDIVSFDNYYLILSLPSEGGALATLAQDVLLKNLRNWKEGLAEPTEEYRTQAYRRPAVFGQTQDDEEDETGLSVEDRYGLGTHPALRTKISKKLDTESIIRQHLLHYLEYKIIFAVAIALFIALLLLIIMWVFR